MSLPPLKRYEMRLADICEALHMSFNGSGDALDPDVEGRYIAHLKDRLATWHASRHFESDYDAAYRAMCEAVLKERAVPDGARRLRALFESDGSAITGRTVAEALGLSRQAVWGWSRGAGRPSDVHRAAIERITGIPVSAWLTEDERREVAEIEARARGGA